MIKKITRRIKKILKNPAAKFIYKTLAAGKTFPERRPFGKEELRLVYKALRSQNLFGIDGHMVPQFERKFAATYGVSYAAATTSGTAAIHTALGALNLNPGDEVITAPITDIGTIAPILYQNAIPVFADINDTYNMDPACVEQNISSRTKAIIVVHFGGNPCNMDAMAAIAKKYNIPLIEDCAQAHVTEYKGRYAGAIGDIGCFSFQQSKHMTTGDGGMVITGNKAYYEKMKRFIDKNNTREEDKAREYLSLAPNYRMNELTAAVGIAQLKKVKETVRTRHALGEYLSHLISDIKEIIPAPVTEGAKHSYWTYPLYLKNIDTAVFAKEIKKNGVWASRGFSVKPVYLAAESLTDKKTYGQTACPFTCKYTDKNYDYKEGLCPKAEEVLKHLICIWLNECWQRPDIEWTANAIRKCVKNLNK